jgi:hypothetical protein
MLPWFWIPGLRQVAHPGMTMVEMKLSAVTRVMAA